MYQAYRPYTMVPKGTSVTVHVEPEKPCPELEEPQEIPEEKPRKQKRQCRRRQKPTRMRSQ